ncbi:MAG: carboxypeptidase-like regulatory domain-containing protein, partial [Cytophagales bacterium]|nr:carboxypeptidase-like regulatory domain-containing protein [Cytophagales bacterium]
MKKLIISLLLFAPFSSLYGQTYSVSGKVVSQVSPEPLKGATVFVQSLNLNSTTDSLGNYRLRLPKGDYTIEVFSLGMAVSTRAISVDQDLIIDFYLVELSENLEEVEIRDSLETPTGISRLRAVENFGIYEAKKNELILLDDFAANKVNNNAR